MAAGVQSVVRALRILETVARREQPTGVRELARALDLKAPTAHALIKTLAAQGYLTQEDGTNRYRLGVKCFTMARAFLRQRALVEVAMPHMEKLATDTGETVLLAIMEAGHVVWAAQARGTRDVVANLEDHPPVQTYETACGRTLLAHAKPAVLDAFVAAHPIAESTGEHIRTRRDLDKELETIRRRGYASMKRKTPDARSAVAAPIWDATGIVSGAIGLSMPSMRFRRPHLTMVVDGILSAAREVSSALGYVQTRDT